MESFNYNDYMRTITTSLFSFEAFRTGDTLYVDKTMYAYRLVTNSRKNFFFLSRPRRFGKSLFCSMLHALFEGKKELFKGLYIAEKTDYAFRPYPVLHFDFSGMEINGQEDLHKQVCRHIRYQGKINGVDLGDASNPADMLDDLIVRLSDVKGPVVIIVDEFDAPVTSNSDDAALCQIIRKTFNAFYATIKKNTGRLRFFFITGVLRLANMSIFSAMNNLVDISMNPAFAAAFGYTETEFLEYFGEGIDEHMEISKDEDRESFIGRIREYYDGYRFSPDSDITVYNPVSIGSFFNEECRFRNYWDMTGMSSMAVDLATNYDLSAMNDDKLTAAQSAFTFFDIYSIADKNLSNDSIVALLYYSGYLTLYGSDQFLFYFRFSNHEIASSFSCNLISRYTQKANFMEHWLSSLSGSCKERK